jgi:cupin fold WbuC family metalloprotein
MPMKLFDDPVLDDLTEAARQNPRRRQNLNLHPHDDFCAHRLFNAIEPGSYIRPHRHLDPNKDETFLLVRGRLAVLEFSADGAIVAKAVLAPGHAADVAAGVWHTAISLQPGTIFFEAKAGPYRPMSEKEFAPWAPAAESAAAGPYLAALTALLGVA